MTLSMPRSSQRCRFRLERCGPSGLPRRIAHVEVLENEVANPLLGRHEIPSVARADGVGDGMTSSTSVVNRGAGGLPGATRTNCSYSSPVDSTPTSAMLSAFESESRGGARAALLPQPQRRAGIEHAGCGERRVRS